jgi:flagellar biosynthesis GTPase FlhF
MGFDLNALRSKANTARRAAEAAKPHEERRRQEAEEAERRRQEELLANERRQTAADAEQKLKQALEDAAAQGNREATIRCSKSRKHCSQQDVGSFFTFFSHVHTIDCMDDVTRALWFQASALGLKPKLERLVNPNCGYGGHSVGMHSDTCISYKIIVRF